MKDAKEKEKEKKQKVDANPDHQGPAQAIKENNTIPKVPKKATKATEDSLHQEEKAKKKK